MFDYENLSDTDFEILCADIMSKKLNCELQTFTKGKDGGIDIADDIVKMNIMVQAKHYYNRSFATLFSSLKKELSKVKANKPKKYYICCSTKLTPGNKKSIKNYFGKYISSTQDILGLADIQRFLEKEENADILQTHYKLWINSTSILTDRLTNDIFIDCTTLKEECDSLSKLFVYTTAFEKALYHLEKKKVLIIAGEPGVGKTMTSKMLIQYYIANKYKVRYTTDIYSLSELKKSISSSPKTKEIVLIDDCLGHAYKEMKLSQTNELLSLMNFISASQNKILILNSRISILSEAEGKYIDFKKKIEDDNRLEKYTIDMKELSVVDKTRILISHLRFYNVPSEYIRNLKQNRSYLQIIKHNNYNPRLIETFSRHSFINRYPASNYAKSILDLLRNPKDVWHDEFHYRLEQEDRYLLITLYSLTSNSISDNVLRKCYNNLIRNKQGIDPTNDCYNSSLARLNESFIKIVCENNVLRISALNQSVNDFLREEIKNYPNLDEFIEKSLNVNQLIRLFPDRWTGIICELFNSEKILKYVFENDEQRIGFITYYCVSNDILNPAYKELIQAYVQNPQTVETYEGKNADKAIVLTEVFEKKFCDCYCLQDIAKQGESFLRKALDGMNVQESVSFLNSIDYLFCDSKRAFYINIVEELLSDIVETHTETIYVDDYDIDLESIVEDSYYPMNDIPVFSKNAAIKAIEDEVIGKAADELNALLDELPADIRSRVNCEDSEWSVYGADSAIEAYLGYPDYDDTQRPDYEYDDDEIIRLFEEAFPDG